MNRKEFEKYLGKKVKITIYDNEIITGTLYRTDDKRFKNRIELYGFKKYYALFDDSFNDVYSCLFRVSHVKKIEVMNDD